MIRTIAIALLASAPSLALAAPGDHIRAGDVGIIPKIDVGAEARTNVYRDESVAIPAANFRVAPGLLVASSGEDHEFRLDGQWVLRKYFFVGADPRPAPDVGRVINLDRYDEYNLGLGTNLFRKSVIGLRLSDDSALQNFRADAEYANVPYSSQLRNHLAGALRISPGEALQILPGGSWKWDSFRVPASDDRPDRELNERNTYGPTLAVRWAFLPRTAFVADASWARVDWTHNTLDAVPSQAYGDNLALPDGSQTKATVGLEGRFTEKLFAQVDAGYGIALYNADTVTAVDGGTLAADDDVQGVDGLLRTGQLRYSITPSDERRRGSSIAAGYVRDFRSSFFTNYVRFDQVFADFQGRLGDVAPSLRYELRFEDYGGEVQRKDIVNRVSADIKVAASDWASITGGGWWQQRASEDPVVEYDDVNFHLMATFTY
ncbi:MAG: hypothetical protein R3F59_07385 [Myxococcota bacterium]